MKLCNDFFLRALVECGLGQVRLMLFGRPTAFSKFAFLNFTIAFSLAFFERDAFRILI